MASFTLSVEDTKTGLQVKFACSGFPNNPEEADEQSAGAFGIYVLFDIVFQEFYGEPLMSPRGEDF